MPRWPLLLALLVLTCACAPRDPARLGGDPGGTPVAVTVRYDRHAADLLTDAGGFTRTVVVERGPWPDPWLYGPACRHHFHHHPRFVGAYGAGWGPDHAYEPSTSLHLLLGRGPAEGQYLRLELGDESWSGTVPVTPGTEVVVSLQASGGRSGWREIGRFTPAAGTRVLVRLEGAKPAIETTETQTPVP